MEELDVRKTERNIWVYNEREEALSIMMITFMPL